MLQDSQTWNFKYIKVFMGNEQILNDVDGGIYTYKQKRLCEMSPSHFQPQMSIFPFLVCDRISFLFATVYARLAGGALRFNVTIIKHQFFPMDFGDPCESFIICTRGLQPTGLEKLL